MIGKFCAKAVYDGFVCEVDFTKSLLTSYTTNTSLNTTSNFLVNYLLEYLFLLSENSMLLNKLVF